MPGRLTNFEIYGDEPEALAAFYRELLGWRIERAEGVDYWRIAIDAGDSAARGRRDRAAARLRASGMDEFRRGRLAGRDARARRRGSAAPSSKRRPRFRARPGTR